MAFTGLAPFGAVAGFAAAADVFATVAGFFGETCGAAGAVFLAGAADLAGATGFLPVVFVFADAAAGLAEELFFAGATAAFVDGFTAAFGAFTAGFDALAAGFAAFASGFAFPFGAAGLADFLFFATMGRISDTGDCFPSNIRQKMPAGAKSAVG